MELFNALAQADWTRAARFWLLAAATLAALESAYHFRGVLNAWFRKGGDHV
ncbi:hypothetical protein ACFQ3P_33150 [Paraburkholderia sabiae]|uniref:Uncharacterized protein n=1 Tax=Paraburkholderia sabiae TaxID=273251 RepID=A0ABU9QJQ9_9BURK|nr:hypothetical protein [Paraburkholderia sabiae]WJZ79801.1 hypothetical protein QEN71_43980 [Paraburkholderia sabiae]